MTEQITHWRDLFPPSFESMKGSFSKVSSSAAFNPSCRAYTAMVELSLLMRVVTWLIAFTN